MSGGGTTSREEEPMAVPTHHVAEAGTLPQYRSDPDGSQPPLDFPAYRSTGLRHPNEPLILLPQRLTEVTGPVLGPGRVGPLDHDLTRQHAGEPIGQRIIVHGTLRDGNGRPVPNSLVEIWQANAGGRYRHKVDNWPSPLDPNFTGVGRALTDAQGHYEFVTIKPGAYPWGNHDNAWRPAHTQMYFPDDPLFAHDPVVNSVPDEAARQRMVSQFDLDNTVEQWALGFRFDIVLRGRSATPFEEPHQ
jgi:protocatechuate 3,4-dioxygenase beta subunit